MKRVFAPAVLYASMSLGFSQVETSLDKWQAELKANPRSSIAHFQICEILMQRRDYQSAANEYREALIGDLKPRCTEVWSHINLGRIFEITGQHERAVNEYRQALRTQDNTRGALDKAAEYLKQEEPADDLPLPAGASQATKRMALAEPIERTEPEYV
jgi:tetratricopeptide (TPR) repeat protein